MLLIMPPTPNALSRLLDRVPLWMRMAGYCVAFLLAILVLAPWVASRLDAFRPDLRPNLPPAVRWAGLGLFAILLALYLTASAWLSIRGRGAYVEFDPPRQFVAEGPFRYCRNPIAACVLGMLLGLGLWHSSLGILLLFLAGIPVAHAQVILLEEPLLRKRFGAAYETYLRRVPRWIPRRPRNATP
jgi:protein-S-isoprenylcysteine O-methyltransferase Ste14